MDSIIRLNIFLNLYKAFSILIILEYFLSIFVFLEITVHQRLRNLILKIAKLSHGKLRSIIIIISIIVAKPKDCRPFEPIVMNQKLKINN